VMSSNAATRLDAFENRVLAFRVSDASAVGSLNQGRRFSVPREIESRDNQDSHLTNPFPANNGR
jgi:hypothetical protein